MIQAKKVMNVPNSQLGEGPIWDYREEILYWVDIMNGVLHRFYPKKNHYSFEKFDQYLGAAVPCEDGQFILAMQNGFAFFNPKTQQLTPIADPENHLPNNRFNDGKCDPAGRFWAGSMEQPGGPPTGSFYCVNNDLTIHKKLSNIHISNGLDWTSDGQKMYYIDTLTHKVQSFHFDVKTGEIDKEKDFLHFEKGLEYPDGMTLDANDNLWIAFYGLGKVICFDGQTGQQLQIVEVPASFTTSCAFGGTDLDTLYITTSTKEGEPDSGALFAVKPGVKGRKAYFFKSVLL